MRQIGAIPWIFTMPHMSDACLQQLATNIAPYCPTGSSVIFELMDEHWNFGQPGVQYCVQYGRLLNYIAPGTVVNDFYTIPLSGSPALSFDQAYVCMVAHQHEILQTQFDSLGAGVTVLRLFGSQWITPSVTANMVNFGTGDAVTKKVPMSLIATGPYVGPPATNVTFNDAIATTGTNPGSWPVTAINDYCADYLKYSLQLWDPYSGHYSAIQAYGTNGGPTGIAGQVNGLPAMVGYEGDFNGPNGSATLLGAAASHDMFYSPGLYPPYGGCAAATTAFLQGLQDGDPRAPGSGFSGIAITGITLGWGSRTEFQGQVAWQNQAPGDGLGNLYPTFQGQNLYPPYDGQSIQAAPNQFSSAQGGAAGGGGYGVAYDRQNQAISLNAMLDWIGGTAAPTLTPSFIVKPTRIQPNVTTPRTLTLVGSGTSWTSGSAVSITNSVTGTTTVTAGTWTAITTTEATLAVTTSTGTGTFTITVDGITSAPLVVGARRKGWYGGMSRLARIAS